MRATNDERARRRPRVARRREQVEQSKLGEQISRREADEADELGRYAGPWADPSSPDYDPTDPSGYWWRLRREQDERAASLFGW